ncbi:MAG TPA: glycosyltransferase [Vicinamibacterales bacterium]|jgi:glycosyltransferase involved in cell wall biosynthesis|nr:glycosyltransferase [Vicinamibacterales bacterium]
MASGVDERQATEPRVTVLIPCYNQGAYLDDAVESVLAQTYQDFEILIVDDGSTDPDTVRLFDGYVRPKTTVYRTPNRKLAAARNFLIQRARGEYLCALDADDKLHPQYLEKTTAALERDPSLGFVSTRLQMFGAETRVWPPDTRCDLVTLLCDDPVHCAALARRSAVLAVGGYDERMPHQGDEDWDLSISLVEAGHAGIILDDILFFYRRRPGSMCDECTRGQVQIDLTEYLVRKHAASYRAHWQDVVRFKDRVRGELQTVNGALEKELSTLASTVERRREELALLKRRVDEANQGGRAQVQRLNTALHEHRTALASAEAAHRSAVSEIMALRSSASWRITAPLRALYDLLLGARNGGGA